jgi:hypothetical protein
MIEDWYCLGWLVVVGLCSRYPPVFSTVAPSSNRYRSSHAIPQGGCDRIAFDSPKRRHIAKSLIV